MAAVRPEAFEGFDDELERVRGDEALEVYVRARMCRRRVTTLYVASGDGGRPMYAQWLVRAEDQAALHAAAPRLFPELAPGEALVEGAYTFVGSRRLGAMGDGMHQLLERAAEQGDRSVYTYVGVENIASLRGCANAGFSLDHVRLTKRRLGTTRVDRGAPGAAERAVWEAAVARRAAA